MRLISISQWERKAATFNLFFPWAVTDLSLKIKRDVTDLSCEIKWAVTDLSYQIPCEQTHVRHTALRRINDIPVYSST